MSRVITQAHFVREVNDLQLTVVIPTYNEAENLPKLVSALFALPIPDFHILFVDDNSPDGTGDLAEKLGGQNGGRVSVLRRPGKMGLGTAYLDGFRQALNQVAQIVVQMDADFSHPPEKVVELVDALQNCDVAIGSRYIAGGKLDDRWPLWRKALSTFGNTYARTILGMSVCDVTAGFRAWRRDTLLAMPLNQVRSNGYAFQVEMAYVASRLGFKLCEIPIFFADRRWGQSKMSTKIQVEAAVRVWQLLVQYRHLHKVR
jgi:dolichol-phosphate mannosyltransferase